jgi:hypothetical protein
MAVQNRIRTTKPVGFTMPIDVVKLSDNQRYYDSNIMEKNIEIKPNKLFFIIIILFLSFSLITQANPVIASEVKPIFYESFDNYDSIKANGGTYSNITLEQGKSGKGVLIQGKGNLVFPAKNHFNFLKGTIAFWVKPNWDGRYDLHGSGKHLLEVIWGNTQSLTLLIAAYSPPRIQNLMRLQFNDRGTYNRRVQSREPFTIMQWKPGEWHKVMIFWDFTIPDNPVKGHQSYLVTKVDDIFTQYLQVAPVAPEPMSPHARIIVGQGHVLGRSPADAVIDELEIYDTSLLPVVPFPEYQFNPFQPQSEATFRKLFANDGFCSNFETHSTDPADCPKLSDSIQPGEKVLFYQRPAFEPVYENYVPQEAEIHTQLNYQAPKGEYKIIFFNVYSRIDLNKVKVTYTEFQGAHGTIPKTDLDLRVVKNWFQAAQGKGTGADQLPVYIPGLLLHNDQIPLETDKTLSRSKVPSLPILHHVETKIPPYTSRQFAMIVKVPPNAAPGSYLSTVTLKAAGLPAQNLKLNLKVLPFALRDSGKIYSIWYSLDADKSYAAKMGLDIFEILRRDLADIKNHGFNSIIFYSYNDAYNYKPLTALDVATKKITAARQAGFKRAVIYTGVRPAQLIQDITPALKEMMVRNGFVPWFYGVDEIALNRKLDEHIKKSMHIHLLGGKVVTTTHKVTSDALDDPHSPVYRSFPAGTYEPLDWVIYPLSERYLYDLMAGRAQKNPNKIETYYWQCRDFRSNRYLFGYFPWISGLDGGSIHKYRGGGSKGQFYNDFDWTGPKRRFRAYLLAAPSVEGPVPTFQWEAAREGIEDGKYLATWKYYQNKAAKINPELARQSEKIVNNLLDRYRDRFFTIDTADYRISMAQYAADRKTIINEIEKLMAVTKKEANAHSLAR